MRFWLFFVLTCKLLLAEWVLAPHYAFTQESIRSRDLFEAFDADFAVLDIPPQRLSHRVTSRDIIERFKAHGYTIRAAHSITTFERHFDFDMTPLTQQLRTYYLKYYPALQIKALHVRPRSYMKALPQAYEIEIPPKTYRQAKGTFYLQTQDNKRYFFNFDLEATLPMLSAEQTIARYEELTAFNTRIQMRPFEGFISPPESSQTEEMRAKIRLIKGRIITKRDIESVPLVKRGMSVNAHVHAEGMTLELAVTAEDEGRLYDMITVKKSNGEALRARVTGPASVEIE